jgi:YHS domain-containing protein
MKDIKKAFWLALAIAAVVYAAPLMAETLHSNAYPLDTCIVTGEKLGSMGAPVSIQYKGREFRFCCAGCPPKFQADPEPYIKKIDATIVVQQKPLYALDTCPVLGEKLSATPVEHIVNNRLVLLCCPACVKTIDKDPEKYLAKVDEAAVSKQKPAYPLDTCVVSGKKLDANAIDYIYAGRLVRLAGKDNVAAFEKEPGKYLAKIDEAAKAKK